MDSPPVRKQEDLGVGVPRLAVAPRLKADRTDQGDDQLKPDGIEANLHLKVTSDVHVRGGVSDVSGPSLSV